MIEVETPDAVSIGFTYDMSPEGLFIRSVRIPPLGSTVIARLSLPDGRKVALRGRVQRSYRAPTAMSRILPSGFGLQLTDLPPEDYFRFLATL